MTTNTPTAPSNYVTRAAALLVEVLAEIDASAEIQPSLAPFYTLLVLTTGEDTTLAHVHDAWAMDRSVSRPGHPDLVPFPQLSAETAEWDRPFMLAIRETARRLKAA